MKVTKDGTEDFNSSEGKDMRHETDEKVQGNGIRLEDERKVKAPCAFSAYRMVNLRKLNSISVAK